MTPYVIAISIAVATIIVTVIANRFLQYISHEIFTASAAAMFKSEDNQIPEELKEDNDVVASLLHHGTVAYRTAVIEFYVIMGMALGVSYNFIGEWGLYLLAGIAANLLLSLFNRAKVIYTGIIFRTKYDHESTEDDEPCDDE